jgi:hypothetical protein
MAHAFLEFDRLPGVALARVSDALLGLRMPTCRPVA